MSYVDPGTFTSGSVLTAAQQNVIADDIRYLKTKADLAAFEGCSLARSSTQSIPNNVYTSITWLTDNIDVGGWWTSGTNIVVPVGTVPSGYTKAILEITSSARFDVSATGARYLQVQVNGSTVEQPFVTSGLPSDTTPLFLPSIWAQVSDGDIITVQVKQNSGGALNVNLCAAHVKRIGAV